MDSRAKFALCAVGIFVCYFYFGILQERITRGNYGDERFTYSMSLVFAMCVANYLYALIMSKVVMAEQAQDTTPTKYYAMCAFTYLTAMVASNKALMWVNYPTQVIGKSCKPIPVMILGVLIGRKKYPLLKYLFVFLIVAGVALFMYKDKPKSSTDSTILGIGEILLLLSLTCDGLTGAVQEIMKREHQTKSGHMMTAMNMWSILMLGAALVATREMFEFFSFVQKHPDILWQMSSLSVASALGQHFIFMCVTEFGPLPCSIITTTRKFFTVLGSVLFFGNALLQRQWMGTALVFSGLFLDAAFGKAKPKNP